jgi:hypothetical protein
MKTELKSFDFGEMVGKLLATRRANALSNVEPLQDGPKLTHERPVHIDSQARRQQKHSSQ